MATVLAGYGHFSIKIFLEIILDGEKIAKVMCKGLGTFCSVS